MDKDTGHFVSSLDIAEDLVIGKAFFASSSR